MNGPDMPGTVQRPALTIHRTRCGDGAARRSIAERVHREMHGAVVRATDAKTARRCTHALYDHRRRRRRAWTAMLRVLDDMIAVGVPEPKIHDVIDVLHWYVREQHGTSSDHITPTPRAA